MEHLSPVRYDAKSLAQLLSFVVILVASSFVPPLQRALNDILSRVIHSFLILTQPSRHIKSRSSIPTVPYRFPNGQGNVAKFLQGKENSLLWREKYGSIYRIWSGTTAEIVLTTPEQTKTVFADSDQHHKAINNDSGYLLGQLLGDCVGLISGERWKRVRAVTESAFHREASKTYVDLVVRQVKQRLDEYEDSVSFATGNIDPAKDLKMIPFWIVAEILYGPLSSEMEKELLELVPIREKLFQTALAGGVARFAWSRFLPTDTNKQLAVFKSRWGAFNDAARATAAERGAPRAPVVSYFEAVSEGNATRSEILQTIDEMLFANLDVTLGGLTWILIQLAAHEDERKKLRAEVDKSISDAPSAYLTSSSTYLQNVISESSRLRPLAAFSVPQSAPTTRILDGYEVPAGTNFIIDSHSLNERNLYWGKDATTFRPERFENSSKTEARYNFWRFGFGPRQCQGRYVADLIVRTIITEVVRRYELKLRDAKGEWKRDPEMWISNPDMNLECRKREPTSTESSKPVWKPGGEMSGFQLTEAEISQRLSDEGRNLLEKYSGVKDDELIQHIATIQQQAYADCPAGYRPFIGYIRFLAFPLLSHPNYAEVLAMLTPQGDEKPKILLDVGCCFGQDMRQLILDGANLSTSVGVDIESSFLSCGYQLFRDSPAKVRSEVADIFKINDPPWFQLDGKVDIVHVSNFFHGFDWALQRSAALQIGGLVRGGEAGRLIVGCCVGSTNPREVAITSKEKLSYCHDGESFARLWKEVGDELDMKFKVEAELAMLEDFMRLGPLAEESMRMITFKIVVG